MQNKMLYTKSLSNKTNFGMDQLFFGPINNNMQVYTNSSPSYDY